MVVLVSDSSNPKETAKMEVTTRAFQRSHSSKPRGRGTWAFQASASDVAFDADLFGPVVFFGDLTFTQAKSALRQSGATGLWAVLP